VSDGEQVVIVVHGDQDDLFDYVSIWTFSQNDIWFSQKWQGVCLYYLGVIWVLLVKMAFDLSKSDKGYLYCVSNLGVLLVKIGLNLIKKYKYYLY
jgi:hypothetical protein